VRVKETFQVASFPQEKAIPQASQVPLVTAAA
jgi:hypothetical protein